MTVSARAADRNARLTEIVQAIRLIRETARLDRVNVLGEQLRKTAPPSRNNALAPVFFAE